MDDIYIIHEDKKYLKQLLKEIEQICDELGLFINAKKTQIIKLPKGFTYKTNDLKMMKYYSFESFANSKRYKITVLFA